MSDVISSLWKMRAPDLDRRLLKVAADAGEEAGERPIKVFFRADDIGVPGSRFGRLMDLFSRHGVPLALGVVPAWLSDLRWRAMSKWAHSCAHLWCWHQHGWRHVNHQRAGKKGEFGADRRADEVGRDLTRGRLKLKSILGDQFTPLFTPPWNRCDDRTLHRLQADGYLGVSRSNGSLPRPPEGLPDYAINIDLHTRKETDPIRAWNALSAELLCGARQARWGVMIHHQRMNAVATRFLDRFLGLVQELPFLQPVSITDCPESYTG